MLALLINLVVVNGGGAVSTKVMGGAVLRFLSVVEVGGMYGGAPLPILFGAMLIGTGLAAANGTDIGFLAAALPLLEIGGGVELVGILPDSLVEVAAGGGLALRLLDGGGAATAAPVFAVVDLGGGLFPAVVPPDFGGGAAAFLVEEVAVDNDVDGGHLSVTLLGVVFFGGGALAFPPLFFAPVSDGISADLCEAGSARDGGGLLAGTGDRLPAPAAFTEYVVFVFTGGGAAAPPLPPFGGGRRGGGLLLMLFDVLCKVLDLFLENRKCTF